MILGTGIDVIDIARIARSVERFGNHFLQRVYTAGEIAYCQRKRRNAAESYAARFAAKEAAAKALGTGIGFGVTWREIEVGREPAGRPLLLFHGRAAQRALHHAYGIAVHGACDPGRLSRGLTRGLSRCDGGRCWLIQQTLPDQFCRPVMAAPFGTLFGSVVVLCPGEFVSGKTSEVPCPVNRKCSGHNSR